MMISRTHKNFKKLTHLHWGKQLWEIQSGIGYDLETKWMVLRTVRSYISSNFSDLVP